MNASRYFIALLAAVSVAAQTPVTDSTATSEETSVASPVAAPAESTPAASSDDRLATALRSFSILQNENDRLRAEIRTLEASNSELTARLSDAHMQSTSLQNQLATTSATASEADVFRNQLRQTQDQLNAVIAENAQLRTRLAITISPPGSVLGVPTRPGSAALTSAPVVEQPKAPEPRYHIVAQGETLSKIAKQYYGDSNRWAEILEANRSKLTDERNLSVGFKLLIP